MVFRRGHSLNFVASFIFMPGLTLENNFVARTSLVLLNAHLAHTGVCERTCCTVTAVGFTNDVWVKTCISVLPCCVATPYVLHGLKGVVFTRHHAAVGVGSAFRLRQSAPGRVVQALLRRLSFRLPLCSF